jgi:septal ring factor EnvC (AmiA/AmiB activator)
MKKGGEGTMANVTNEMILQAVKELSAQLINHKDETNQRFEHIDKHFEQIDKRFEQIDKRFEQIDQRFERLEKEIGQIKEQLTDLATGQKILVEELFNNKTEIKRIKNVLKIY